MLEDLSVEESALLNHLGEAWNMFVDLPELHAWEKVEFMHKIHELQKMIMARPIVQQVNSSYEDPVQSELKIVERQILTP